MTKCSPKTSLWSHDVSVWESCSLHWNADVHQLYKMRRMNRGGGGGKACGLSCCVRQCKGSLTSAQCSETLWRDMTRGEVGRRGLPQAGGPVHQSVGEVLVEGMQWATSEHMVVPRQRRNHRWVPLKPHAWKKNSILSLSETNKWKTTDLSLKNKKRGGNGERGGGSPVSKNLEVSNTTSRL